MRSCTKRHRSSTMRRNNTEAYHSRFFVIGHMLFQTFQMEREEVASRTQRGEGGEIVRHFLCHQAAHAETTWLRKLDSAFSPYCAIVSHVETILLASSLSLGYEAGGGRFILVRVILCQKRMEENKQERRRWLRTA